MNRITSNRNNVNTPDQESDRPNATIPALEELKQFHQWVGYRYPDKLPLNPHNGRNAKSNQPSTWGPHATAVAGRAKYGFHGTGFVVTESDDYAGIDCDDCRRGSWVEPAVLHWRKRFNSFSYVTPSKSGERFIIHGKLKKAITPSPFIDPFEAYDHGRYFTITDMHIEGTPGTIESRQAELDAFYDTVMSNRKSKAKWDKELREKIKELGEAVPGTRNTELSKLAFRAGVLIEKYGMREEAIVAVIWDVCKDWDNPEKSEGTLRRQIEEGRKRTQEEKGNLPQLSEYRPGEPQAANGNGNGMAPPAVKRKFTYASEIEPKDYQWLWEDRIAIGEYTLAVGDAGVGKGLCLSKLIAHVTKGNPLPGDTRLFPGGVILMSPEDSPEHTIAPRLMAAKADLSKVLLLTHVEEIGLETSRASKRPISFPEDTPILIEAIEDAHGSLVVIDPVLSLLSDKVDAHKNHAVRRALSQVLDAARDNGCALLGIMHTTKAQHPKALFRSSSSSAFMEMARAALFFVADPDGDPGQSGVIVNYKNNLRKKAPPIRYAIHQSDGNIGYISWEGMSAHSEEELLNQESVINNKKSEHEEDIVAVLKAHEEAMTAEEIQPFTRQKLPALCVMLSRKVGEGIVMRTSRGKYTYPGNPLYSADVKNVKNVKNVRNVENVKNGESDTHELTSEFNISNNVKFKTSSEGALEDASDTFNTFNILNINKHDTDVKNEKDGSLDRLKRVFVRDRMTHVFWRLSLNGWLPDRVTVQECLRRLEMLLASDDVSQKYEAMMAIAAWLKGEEDE